MKVSSAMLNGYPIPSPVKGLVHTMAAHHVRNSTVTVVAVSEKRQFSAGVVTYADENEVQMFSLVEHWPIGSQRQELMLLRDAYILSKVTEKMVGENSYSFSRSQQRRN